MIHTPGLHINSDALATASWRACGSADGFSCSPSTYRPFTKGCKGVRQWPGNGADLNFRGVISKCTAVVVACSTNQNSSLSRSEMTSDHERETFLRCADDDSWKKVIAFFRLWCIVELAAAVETEIPVIIKVGKCVRPGGRPSTGDTVRILKGDGKGKVAEITSDDGEQDEQPYRLSGHSGYYRESDVQNTSMSADPLNRFTAAIQESPDEAFTAAEIMRMIKQSTQENKYVYNTEGGANMLINLAFMIDVAEAECTVPSDLEREMSSIRSGIGIEVVNGVTRGALRGGHVSAQLGMREVDAAVCGEYESLMNMPPRDVGAALIAASAGGRAAVVEWLLTERSEDTRSSLFTAMWRAAAGSHVMIVKSLSALCMDQVDNVDRSGATALWIASQNGHHQVVDALLLAGATADKVCTVPFKEQWCEPLRCTPLQRAAEQGHTAVVASLLRGGAAVDETGESGETALCKASKSGHETTCQELLSARANVDAFDAKGVTPLYWATTKKKLRVIACLIAAGASIEIAESGLKEHADNDYEDDNGGRRGGRQLMAG